MTVGFYTYTVQLPVEWCENAGSQTQFKFERSPPFQNSNQCQGIKWTFELKIDLIELYATVHTTKHITRTSNVWNFKIK